MAPLHLTESDDGKRITATAGSDLILSLAENPTTGYRWKLDDLDQQILKQGDAFFEPASSAIGGGGTRVFHFTATHPGETKLRAKHWREWEGDGSITRRYQVSIEVTP